jgi:hypothetical protein
MLGWSATVATNVIKFATTLLSQPMTKSLLRSILNSGALGVCIENLLLFRED